MTARMEHRRGDRGGSARTSGLRELDPAVDDDPGYLLAIGLALATGDFTEAGAEELERAAALEAPIRLPHRRRSLAVSSSGRVATRRVRSCTSTGP